MKKNSNDQDNSDFAKEVGLKTTRKLKARRSEVPGVWLGFGMMGLIGWSVVVPTLIGAALGSWLDSFRSDEHAWTLALLMAGLTLGCFNAWHWLDKEDKAIHAQNHTENNKHPSNDSPKDEPHE